MEPSSSSTSSSSGSGSGSGSGSATLDFTAIPALLDKRYEALDPDNALRPTIINPTASWTRISQKSLLAEPVTASLSAEDQTQEKVRAFDLLDALSRSGALPMEKASLHVIIAATHTFDKTVVDCVVQGNVNPIEKVERSSLIVGSTVQGCTVAELLKDDQVSRIQGCSPALLLE